MALERELAAYKLKLPELAAHEGKWALFHGDDFVDVFGTYEDAIKAGYRNFKLEPFMVKRVELTPRPRYITLFKGLCHTPPGK